MYITLINTKLEENYSDALLEINDRIERLLARDDANLQNVIYQVEYQKSLKSQVQTILETLQNNEFETVSEYLAKSYEDGFIGTMYDLQGQGIPLVIPIDQEQVVAAIQHETKLSEGLYAALGKDTKRLSKQIAGEISRGISNNATYAEMARNIASFSNIPRNNAARIARTEAHRIQCKATADAQWKAKEKGADVVKQWDASLDGKTRDTHRQLDGQIRELDEPFEVDGMTAMQPGGFGDPAEDCNCRCALLQRARWALGNDFTKWDKESGGLVEIKAEDYDSFKMKYATEAERVRSSVQMMNDEDTLEKSGKSSTISLEDTLIHRSVGAKSRNYDVISPDSGDVFHFVEGTKIQNSEVFAGKGTKHSLHEGVAEGLAEQYGGNPEKWQHCKGNGVIDFEGEERKAEVHWFQEENVGKVKFKVKRWIDED